MSTASPAIVRPAPSWQKRPVLIEGRLRLTPIDHEQEREDARGRLAELLSRPHIATERRVKLERRLRALQHPPRVHGGPNRHERRRETAGH
jgi:hypothetical protein